MERYNAAMESFFSLLKTERTARETYRTRDQAKADVFDYIECLTPALDDRISECLSENNLNPINRL